MEDLSNKPISYTGNHPLERDYRALRARLAIAEAERDEYKLQRDKWIADEPAIEAERDDLRDANGVLSEALEAARQKLVELTARVAELEAQLAAAGSRVIELEAAQDESYHAYLELKEEADSRGEPLREACRQNMILTARVAELEAQLAAQGWRPVTEEWPPYEESTPVRMRNGVIRWGYRRGDFWYLTGGKYGREGVTHAYELPPAPQETE